jgi:hypothetical protein
MVTRAERDLAEPPAGEPARPRPVLRAA